MLRDTFINPSSIVVVGGSDNITKPGGKLLFNLNDGRFGGDIFVINPGKNEIQGFTSFKSPKDLNRDVELGIIAIPAEFALDSIKELFKYCNTKDFIIISAGFGEIGEAGSRIEIELKNYASENGVQIVGPNCTGIITPFYSGVFTTPIPECSVTGVDLISASGATAVFLMEEGIPLGLKFNHVFSVGNGLMNSVEEILEFLDDDYHVGSSKTIMLYLETIKNPEKLHKHAISLWRKGCKILALKAGKTVSGSKAASSHTGAISVPNDVVNSLFRKSRIVVCDSREELVYATMIATQNRIQGRNVAVITHAGGPGVLTADALESNGFELPQLPDQIYDIIFDNLPNGASSRNPFDILATGGMQELTLVMDNVLESKIYDSVIVIFGSPGLFDESEIFRYLSKKVKKSTIPIYTVIPSLINAEKEIQLFTHSGNTFYVDETLLVVALNKVLQAFEYPLSDYKKVESGVGDELSYLPQRMTHLWLASVGFRQVKSIHTMDKQDIFQFLEDNKRIVLKTSETTHKTDVGGVKVGLTTVDDVLDAINDFDRKDISSYVAQMQVAGHEIYLGVKYEENFGFMLLFGKGGTLIEIEKDIEKCLFPINSEEAEYLVEKLHNHPVWVGYRNQPGLNKDILIKNILKLNEVVKSYPEIKELDINPMICNHEEAIVVDARILV